ncbi:3-hydroxyacyl-CoA dehydrogenase family protein [Nocardia sp. NPDC004260]
MTTYGIAGAGCVGSAIARGLASGGNRVLVMDEVADRADRLADEQPAITAVDEISGLLGCDVVIEAVPDDLDTKISVLGRLAASSTVIVLTATSSFTVAQLAQASGLRRRLAGFHFLPTAVGSGLVEICGDASTGSEAVVAAVELSDTLGMPWMHVADVPGRITRRLLVPFVNQVLAAAARGIASPPDIDRIVELGLGHAVGPLVALKHAGLDDHIQVAENLYRWLGDPAFVLPASPAVHRETIRAISDPMEESSK